MNKEKMYIIKIDVLREENKQLKREIEKLTKQLSKPIRKVGIGVK